MASYSSDPILVTNSGKTLVSFSVTIVYKTDTPMIGSTTSSVGTFSLYGIGNNKYKKIMSSDMPISSNRYQAITIFSPASRDRFPAIRWEIEAGSDLLDLYDVHIAQEVFDNYVDDPHHKESDNV